jgi:hypothetical protein
MSAEIRESILAALDDLAATGDLDGFDALADLVKRAGVAIEYRSAACHARLTGGSIERALRLEHAADVALGTIEHGADSERAQSTTKAAETTE